MKQGYTTITIIFLALLSLGVTAENKKTTDSITPFKPKWLTVTVTPWKDGLFEVSVQMEIRKNISHYDLELLVAEGENKGLKVPIKIQNVRNEHFHSTFTIPARIIDKTQLSIVEREQGASIPDPIWFKVSLGAYVSTIDR